MKAKELIDLLQRVDGDTEIAVYGECGLTKAITLDRYESIIYGGIGMTHDLAWAERVKYEYKELSGMITRLRAFLETDPKISEQDMLFLKAQLTIMKDYANILLARLHYHNVEIDEEIKEDSI